MKVATFTLRQLINIQTQTNINCNFLYKDSRESCKTPTQKIYHAIGIVMTMI